MVCGVYTLTELLMLIERLYLMVSCLKTLCGAVLTQMQQSQCLSFKGYF